MCELTHPTLTVVVIDRSPEVREAVRAALAGGAGGRPIQFEGCDYFESAVARCRDSPLPDGVLLSLDDPGLNGLALIAALSGDDRVPGLPIVVMSHSRESPSIRQAMRLGREKAHPGPRIASEGDPANLSPGESARGSEA